MAQTVYADVCLSSDEEQFLKTLAPDYVWKDGDKYQAFDCNDEPFFLDVDQKMADYLNGKVNQ
jgi:hypothetical protein